MEGVFLCFFCPEQGTCGCVRHSLFPSVVCTHFPANSEDGELPWQRRLEQQSPSASALLAAAQEAHPARPASRREGMSRLRCFLADSFQAAAWKAVSTALLANPGLTITRGDQGTFPELFGFLGVPPNVDKYTFPTVSLTSDIKRSIETFLNRSAPRWEAEPEWPKSQASEWNSGVGEGLPAIPRLWLGVLCAEEAAKAAIADEKAEAVCLQTDFFFSELLVPVLCFRISRNPFRRRKYTKMLLATS